jgi:hypothetical protein
MKKTLFLLFLLSIQNIFYGWWDLPHMIVNKIAYDRLDEKVKKELNGYIRAFNPSYDFVTAGCWADDISAGGAKIFSTWHFSDVPYDPEGILTPEKREIWLLKQEGKDILYGINESLKTLKNQNATPWAKGMMLFFLIHFVGDIHQPLHTATLFSACFPKSDCGGNLYKIAYEPSNLHLLWDSGCGLAADRLERPLTKEGKRKLNELVERLLREHPQIEGENNLNICEWRQESYNVAVQYVYQGICPGMVPSQDYLKQGQEISAHQIVLAGYRLATLLNSLCK